MKAALAASPPSLKVTDSPAPILLMPLNATAAANELELSSIFQPVMSMAEAEVLVTSNQSAPTGLSPLDQGATSEINSLPTVPGEPISAGSFSALAALCTPTSLKSAIVVLLRPAELSKVAKSGPDGEAPNTTLARST